MALVIQTYVTDIVKVASFVGFYKSFPSFFWQFIGNIGEVQDPILRTICHFVA